MPPRQHTSRAPCGHVSWRLKLRNECLTLDQWVELSAKKFWGCEIDTPAVYERTLQGDSAGPPGLVELDFGY